ncbi:NADH-quinone oxidoreductase subunit 5 family protein [Streptomyces sp. bgisy159]|uniref:NADH-quinone oxidoreductase subunit 5 family protein n=1 Tax=Streptomyces sp. bgisy159 TaxID=3413795 RepID=UPI003F4A6137
MSAVLWALLALPLACGATLALAGRTAGRWAAPAGVAAAVATLGLAVTAALGRPALSVPLFTGIDAGARVDGLSAVMVVTVAAVTCAVLVFSAGEFGARDNRGRFFGLMLLFAGAMLVTVTATTLPPLLMAWEVMGATSWALIGFQWHERERVAAADVAFLTTRTADLGLYLAAGAAVAGGVGGLRLDALDSASSPWLHVITGGVVASALGKSAQLPFSFWLSRAMEGPSPVSALLHSAAMVAAGAYLLLRLEPLLTVTDWAGPLVAWAGAATALVLGAVAVFQADLKQLLAASTAAQIGFMVLAAGAGGVAGGTAQLVAHAAVKSGLFLVTGVWLTTLGTRRLSELRGAARTRPTVGAAFTVAGLTLAGLPPLSLWATKDEVLAAAYERDPALYAVGLAAAAVAAVYSVRAVHQVLAPMDVRRSGTGAAAQVRPRVPVLMVAPVVVLASAAATLGVLALSGPAAWLRELVGAPGEPTPHAWELVLSAVVVVAAFALGWWWSARERPAPVPSRVRAWAGDWLGLEAVARRLVVRPVTTLARALASFDDRVVDGAVRAVGRGGLTLARAARRVDDGGVDAGVRAVGRGARRLGGWARRPQTGLLHQYYAQAAVGFAVLTLIVLLVR